MFKEKLLEYLKSEDYPGLGLEALMEVFDIDLEDRRIFSDSLRTLETEGLIYMSRKGKYFPVENIGIYKAKIVGNPAGFAFAEPEDKELNDIFIPPNDLKGALHGDIVLVRLTNPAEGDMRAEGKVERILSDLQKNLVGTLYKSDNYGFVEVDNPKFSEDIYISKKDIRGFRNRDKVVVDLTRRASKTGDSPEGKITEVLGSYNDKGIEITAIARTYDLPFEFPKTVLDEVNKLPDEVMEDDLLGRKDFSNLFTVTIDGADAKDFDDAISIEKEGDAFRLYIHIADVAHYVKKGSAIDQEAYKRGNSVYMLDRVIPMLGEKLSNGVCSLNPGLKRLVHTVEILIDQNAKIKEYFFHESFIVSDHRLVYTDVSDFLEGKKSLSDNFLEKKLLLMQDLYEILRRSRDERGAIDFDLAESFFDLDEDGEVLDVRPAERRVANSIIEEFMIVTNETVGRHFGFMEFPFIYRVHEAPTEEKVESFKLIIYNLGYRFKGKKLHPQDYQDLLEKVKNKPEEQLVVKLLLRSMSKAKYSENRGSHFGLASKFYSHFTAPIRRYADLAVHRIFKASIKGNLYDKETLAYAKTFGDLANQASVTERRAEEAERAVGDMLAAQYMKKHIGEDFKGIISSLTNFGIYVQLANTIEGLVQFRDMDDDFYYFDQEAYLVVGERTKKTYKLGQEVRARVVNVDETRYEIDFKFIDGD